MRKAIPFMTLMKEVYFIFNVHIPKPEVCCIFVYYSKTIKVVFLLQSLTHYHQEQNLWVLSIIVYKA